MRIAFLSLTFWAFVAGQAAAAPWIITKSAWTVADEKGFGDFVHALGMSHCTTTNACIHDAANPYRDGDPRGFAFAPDCADLPYMLRVYYAWKNGLPFGYAQEVDGRGRDIRYTPNGNRVTVRRSLVDEGDGLNAPRILQEVSDDVSSATYRLDPSSDDRLLGEFYSPKIVPQSIRAGSVIYDPNGHVAIVYDTDTDGRVYYMDAHPDHTLSRSVYGAQFGQSRMAQGGGLKNWRPMRLLDARRENGRYLGGRVVVAANDEIADFSLEQYRGNVPGEEANGMDARFTFNGAALNYYEYVRVAMAGGKMSYNPVYELQATLGSLCNDVKDRVQAVDQAAKDGINMRAQPAHLPSDIYGSDDESWENDFTPSRDARLRTGFAAFYSDMSRMISMWQSRDPRIIYDGSDFQGDLAATYRKEIKACVVIYTNSAGRDVTLDLDAVIHRLFKLDFDPYHCVEHRWGASGPEAATCPDGEVKNRWYEAEQSLRNETDRDASKPTDLSLSQLANGAVGSSQPPKVDVASLIATIGPRTTFHGMAPVGD